MKTNKVIAEYSAPSKESKVNKNKIKEEHLPFLEKIALRSIEQGWNFDATVEMITMMSVHFFSDTFTNSYQELMIKEFGSLAEITNLCYLIDHHYTLGQVCKQIVQFRTDNGCL